MKAVYRIVMLLPMVLVTLGRNGRGGVHAIAAAAMRLRPQAAIIGEPHERRLMTMKRPKRCQNIIVAMAMLALAIPAFQSTSQAQSVPVPFKGSWTGETYIIGYCPDGRLHYVDVSSTGHATHLGNATWLADVCLDLSVFPAYGTGTGVATAANGDEIYLALTIEVNTLDWTWKETEYYAGGTGRFVDAVGQTVCLGSIAWESQIHGFWSCHMTGSLTF